MAKKMFSLFGSKKKEEHLEEVKYDAAEFERLSRRHMELLRLPMEELLKGENRAELDKINKRMLAMAKSI